MFWGELFREKEMGKECGVFLEVNKEFDDSEREATFYKLQSIVANKQGRSEVISWEYVSQDKADSVSCCIIKDRDALITEISTEVVRSLRRIDILHSGYKLNSCEYCDSCEGGLGEFYRA